MNLEGASIYDAPRSLERFKKMSETITLRGVETNDKANSSLLAVTRNMRPISLRSVSSKESRGSVPTRYTTSPMSDVATDAVAKGSVPSRYTSNPASYVVTNDDRDDITSCCTSTSMDQPYDDIFQKRPSMSTESFGTNPLKVIALQSSILSETPADLDLKRNDEAFESIADLIIDHLSPKVVDGSSHYFLSKENISHLEFLVPMSVRLRFVGALRYRATSLSTSSSNDDIPSSFLVRECTRLGLGRDVKDNILLGGGIKMTDGMTRVMVGDATSQLPSNHYTNKFTIPPPSMPNTASTASHTTSQPHSNDYSDNLITRPPSNPNTANFTPPPDMSWMGQTKLTTEQMQVIMAATDSPANKNERSQNQIPQNQDTTDSTQISHISLPDDMKWMIYAGLSPEQMQVTLNAMNNMKEDTLSTCMTKSTAGDDDDLESRGEQESMAERQVKSPSIVNSESLGYQSRAQEWTYRVPEFAWKDGLQHVFAHGIMHPYCLLSFGAPLLAAGQVMTRLQFNCVGNPSSRLEVRGNFYNLISAIVLWFVLNTIALASFYIHWGRGIVVNFDIMLFAMTNLSMYAFTVYVIANTRYNLREKYRIASSEWLTIAEDYVLTVTLMPFVVAQMGRHTVDYDTINYSIFSPSGLPPEVRLDDAEPQKYTPPGSPIVGVV